MDEKDIIGRIHELVEEEHTLREGTDHTGENAARLKQVGEQLDQCWDLLRQRQALRDSGGDPDSATTRSERTVEGYLG